MQIAPFYNPQSFHALRPLPKEPTRISLTYLIFLETRIIHLHFPADSLCLSSFIFFWWAPTSRKTFLFLKEGRFGRSRSSKVTDIGANRKRICDFLLVRNSNFVLYLAPFRRSDRFYVLLTPPLFNPNLGAFPLHQIADVGRQRAHGP